MVGFAICVNLVIVILGEQSEEGGRTREMGKQNIGFIALSQSKQSRNIKTYDGAGKSCISTSSLVFE